MLQNLGVNPLIVSASDLYRNGYYEWNEGRYDNSCEYTVFI